jgi:hypothetical protein
MESSPPEAYDLVCSSSTDGTVGRFLDHVVRDPDGMPIGAPRGEGEFMDQLPSPRGDRNELSAVDLIGVNGFTINGAGDQGFCQYGQADHSATGSYADADAGDLSSSTEPLTLAGRADIDVAMVEALRLAMDSDQGRAALEWKTPDQMQFDDERRSGGLGEGVRPAMNSDLEIPDA